MADEYFSSFAPTPAMKETPTIKQTTAKVVPRLESIAFVQGNDTATTATDVPRLESLTAVQGNDTAIAATEVPRLQSVVSSRWCPRY